MVFFGPISSIFDILTFGLMWWVFHANTVEMQTLFQSGWFYRRAAVANADCAHDPHPAHSFVQSRAAWPLFAMTLVVMAVGIALPFSPLASYLQLQALPLSYFPWAGGDPGGLYGADPGREGLLQPPLRLAVEGRVFG
ncbi:magnesium-transporting ATPase MgtA [Klebsiella pneumoniae]|uniref:Magnesium-transporting ATPase MgtA n=1 Tax=Klebsiella pneumoniae TaxID=573 RepID=A0A377TKA6_KLEPN|nr:magnesium-transporting ATPase MgtA [Klebsiella pneumoniae]